MKKDLISFEGAQGVSGPSSSCVWNPRVFLDDVQVQTDQRCGRHRATTGYQPQQGVAITIQDAYSRREADKLDFL